MEEYTYPMEEDWTVEEICTVIDFYTCIEDAYEGGIQKRDLMDAYREFKKIVDSKSLERKISDEFQEASGYSIYLTMKKCQEAKVDSSLIKMK